MESGQEGFNLQFPEMENAAHRVEITMVSENRFAFLGDGSTDFDSLQPKDQGTMLKGVATAFDQGDVPFDSVYVHTINKTGGKVTLGLAGYTNNDRAQIYQGDMKIKTGADRLHFGAVADYSGGKNIPEYVTDSDNGAPKLADAKTTPHLERNLDEPREFKYIPVGEGIV